MWTGVGELVIELDPSSRAGAETEMETDGKVVIEGGEEDGGVELPDGKGCRPLTPGEGTGVAVELVLLRLRLRYSTIRS